MHIYSVWGAKFGVLFWFICYHPSYLLKCLRSLTLKLYRLNSSMNSRWFLDWIQLRGFQMCDYLKFLQWRDPLHNLCCFFVFFCLYLSSFLWLSCLFCCCSIFHCLFFSLFVFFALSFFLLMSCFFPIFLHAPSLSCADSLYCSISFLLSFLLSLSFIFCRNQFIFHIKSLLIWPPTPDQPKAALFSLGKLKHGWALVSSSM